MSFHTASARSGHSRSKKTPARGLFNKRGLLEKVLLFYLYSILGVEFFQGEAMNSFKLSGIAIAAGGVSLIIVNAVFTPMLDFDVPFPAMMASKAFLWRLSLAALTVFLLMIGSPGLYAYQTGRSGLFGKIAFGLTFLGCALVFAHEWAQVFFMHRMAVVAPDALQAMEDVEVMSIFKIEGLIVLITFTLGWIAFAASMLVAKVFARLGPALVIAGFFAIPLLTAVTSVKWGGALGNAVLGSGFILLGRELFKNPAGAK